MAKKKSKGKKRKSKKNKRTVKGDGKKRSKSGKRKKKKVRAKKGKKKKGKQKKPIGPSVGPRPIDPATGRPKKKWPKKKSKKWPPRKKRPRGTGSGDDSSLLGFADFAPHIGTIFDIVSYDPPVPVDLIEVAELNETEIPAEFAGQEIRDEPFRLLFLAPQNVDIPQGVYALEHDEMDPQIMLLVPVGPATSDGDYQLELEAVFA